MKLKADKQREADARQDLYDTLTSKQKLAKLDSKLGVGVGAVKQRKRLQKQIEKGD